MARIKKLFTGHQALRPIPTYTSTGEQRAIAAAAAQQKSRKTTPLIKRGPDAMPGALTGTRVAGGQNVKGGVFTGSSSNQNYD